MASRFFWILGFLFALLCLGAAASPEKGPTLKILKTMESEVRTHYKIPEKNQFAVLHLAGKDISGKECHKINFNDAGEVHAHCNFAPAFTEITNLKGPDETTRHAEWQLIHTALEPMLEKWKEEHAGGKDPKKTDKKKIPESEKDDCPEALYLYTFNVPDHHPERGGSTCVRAIVDKIPEILKKAKCGQTTIVVGFSQLEDFFKKEAWYGCGTMWSAGIFEYNLGTGCGTRWDRCEVVTGYDPKNDKPRRRIGP